MTTLFITILNMSMTASIVALAVMLVRLLLYKARVPKTFSYVLWSAVLFRLVFPFSIESIFSLLPTFVTELSFDIISSHGHDNQIMDVAPNAIIDNTMHYQSAQPMDVATNTSALPNVSTNTISLPSLFEIITFFWLIGFITLVIYAIAVYIRLKKRVKFATLITDNIYQSDQIKTPFVLGFIRPKIYFPINVLPPQYDYILKHEQAHIKRVDYLIKPFAYILLALHWFNPIMWLSYLLMSKDMEMSCDEAVLETVNDDIRKAYSYSLLSLSTEKKSLLSPISFGVSNVKERVINVLNYKKTKMWLIAVSVIAIGVFLVAFSLNPTDTTNTTTTTNTSISTPNSPTIVASGSVVSQTLGLREFSGVSANTVWEVVYRQSENHSAVVEVNENILEYLNVHVRNGTLYAEFRSGFGFDFSNGSIPRIYVYAPYITELNLESLATATDWDELFAPEFHIFTNGSNNINISVDVGRLSVDSVGASHIELTGNADSANLTFSGAGAAVINIEAEELVVNNFGTTHLELSGSADIADIAVLGVGKVMALEMVIREATVETDGFSSAYINATEYLRATAGEAGGGESHIRYIGSPLVTSNTNGASTIEAYD